MLNRSVAYAFYTLVVSTILALAPSSALAGQVSLTWDLNTEPDIYGYYLYFGTQSGSYDDPGSPLFIEHPGDVITVTGLQGGQEYFFALTAVDQTGNESLPTAEISAVIAGEDPPPDTTPPTIALTSPADGTTLSGTVTISASASDNVGVIGVQFQLNGISLGEEDTTNEYEISWDTTTIAPGTYTLTAIARDAENNTATSDPITVTVEALSGLTVTNIQVENGSSYEVVNQGLVPGERVYIDRSYTFTNIPETQTGATFIKTANQDKNSSSSAWLSFDVNQPVTVYVAHDPRIATKPAWLDTFTNTGEVLVTTDTSLELWSQAFPAGSISLGGNRGSGGGASMYSVALVPDEAPPADTTPPTAPTIQSAVADSPTQATISWTAATDNVAVTGYTLYRDNTPLTTTPSLSYVDTTLAPSTTYTYSVVAHDAMDNTSEPSATTSVTTPAPPDTTPPTVSITTPASGDTVSGIVVVQATATDNIGVMGVQFQLDGVSLGAEDTTTAYSVSWDTSSILSGSYTLTAIARDAAGNTTTSAPVLVTIENTSTNTEDLEITNLQVQSGNAYVVVSDLDVGQPVYIDRAYTFATVPAILTGAAYLQTANTDKNSTASDFLSFDVNQSVTVYVAHDPRIATKPAWLDTFTNTGEVLVTTDTTLELWSQAFPAGSISLGGNRGSGGGASMYSVALVPDEPLGGETNNDTTPPSVTSITSAIANSSTQVTITWTAATDNVAVTGYNVYRDGTLISTTPGLTYVDTGLNPSTSYAYAVQAVDDAGNTAPLSPTSSVTTEDQEPPANTGTAQLSWQKNPDSDLSHYVVYYGTTSGVYDTSVNVGLTATPTAPSYVVTGLPPGTFYFTVRAVDTSGNQSLPAPEGTKTITN